MDELGELSYVRRLRDYIEAGSIPSNAEEIYAAGLNYLTSEGYMKTWNQPNQHSMSSEEWEVYGGKVANYLLMQGFSERNFKILIQQSIGGVFEYSFILGSILRRNNIEHQWSESQDDWDNVLIEIQELPLS